MSFLQTLLHSLKQNITILETAAEQHGLLGHPPEAWNADDAASLPLDDPEHDLPWPAFAAIEKIRLDLRALDAAVTPTHLKLLDLGLQPARTSCLHVAVSLGVTDAIKALGGEAELADLATELEVNQDKLGGCGESFLTFRCCSCRALELSDGC